MYINNEDICLRAVEVEDNDLLRDMMNDPSIEQMTFGWSFPISKKNQIEWYENFLNSERDAKWIIQSNELSKSIGMIGLTNIDFKNGNAELHIKLSNDNVKQKGFGYQAVTLLSDYCFNQLRLHCIYVEILEYNVASLGLFRKCGFTQEARLQDRVFKNGRFNNVLILSKIKKVED